MGYPTDLTDEHWEFLEPLFPPNEGPGRPRTVDLRRVLNALFYMTRTACPWDMIPKDFPPKGTIRYYFDKWTADGTFIYSHPRRYSSRSADTGWS